MPPVFLSLFGILSKQESTESNAATVASANTEIEYVCDGDACRPLERRSSVKPSIIQEIRNYEKKEEPIPESDEQENQSEQENLSDQSTTKESPAAETTGKGGSCNINGSQPIICRILALLRLRRLSSRCSTTARHKD